MLKNLVESKLSTKLLIIGGQKLLEAAFLLSNTNIISPFFSYWSNVTAKKFVAKLKLRSLVASLSVDTEDASGQDLFRTALRNHIADDSTTKINLICYEHPLTSYLTPSPDGKVLAYDYFTDPCGWSNPSAPKSDLASFISQPDNDHLSDTTIFIDSLTHLVNYHGYCAMYKMLSALKQVAHKILCLAHCDLFRPDQVEELHFLATAFFTLKQCSDKHTSKERVAEVVYKKSPAKVVKQSESFFLVDELRVMSKVSGTKALVPSGGKRDIQDLTTFKLGLQMSENERKAKDELILPYVKSKTGEIIYEPEADELEEDPDDDLDF